MNFSKTKNLKKILTTCTRSIETTGPLLDKLADPIQQMFLDKIREFKSSNKEGKIEHLSPQSAQEWKDEMEHLAKKYGGGEGIDLTKYPEFKFEDPKLDPIDDKVK